MSIKVCNDYANTGQLFGSILTLNFTLELEEKPTLFFEFHGTESNVAADAELVKEIAQGRLTVRKT